MRIKANLFFVILFISVCNYAQVLERYPIGQRFYDGEIFFDMAAVIKSKGFEPCQNPDETYMVSVLVNPDATAMFVKDFDSAHIAKNKCAYDLSRKVFPYLKGWIPAKVGDSSVKAIATYYVYPRSLFEGTKNRRVNNAKVVSPKFNRGNDSFQLIVKDIIERRIRENIDGRSVFFDNNN